MNGKVRVIRLDRISRCVGVVGDMLEVFTKDGAPDLTSQPDGGSVTFVHDMGVNGSPVSQPETNEIRKSFICIDDDLVLI